MVVQAKEVHPSEGETKGPQQHEFFPPGEGPQEPTDICADVILVVRNQQP